VIAVRATMKRHEKMTPLIRETCVDLDLAAETGKNAGVAFAPCGAPVVFNSLLGADYRGRIKAGFCFLPCPEKRILCT